MVKLKITPKNLYLFNQNLRYEDPHTIIKFVLQFAQSPVLTTSFGTHAAAIIHATNRVKKDVPVLWCDTGYNTEATYKHAQNLTERFNLNVEIFTPKFTTAYINASLGVPEIGNPEHKKFAEIVKLEPFERAMEKHQPDIWFTTIRKNQTAYRNTLDILSFTKDGVLRVSPFYHFTDEAIKEYLSQHNLPMEYDYFDPVKAMNHRECGIQFTN